MDAGCEVAPFGLQGPKFFIPYTDQLFTDLAAVGIELMEHHIVALQSDRQAVDGALRSGLSKKKRPGLCYEQPQSMHADLHRMDHMDNVPDHMESMVAVEGTFCTDSSFGFTDWQDMRPST
jgi:hypothetical protein